MRKDKSVIIPPYWLLWVLGLTALYVGLFVGEPYWEELSRWDTMSLHEKYTFRTRKFLVFCGAYLPFTGSFHYSIHKKYIMVRFLCIPVRIIRWDKVSTAQYLYQWGSTNKYAQWEKHGKSRGQGIFVTLKGCPPFVPELDGLDTFTLRHPIGSFFIRFTPRQQKKYVKIFQSYFPELSFQFGYEKNFEKGLPYDDLDP